MEKENQEKFQCPECESKIIRFRFIVSTKDKNNPYANVMRSLGYAGVDETSPLFKTGVASTLRNRAYESPLIALQRIMGVPK